MDRRIIVIGAGAAGLSAALALAEKGINVLLVSEQPSERSQSVMAEGGINAAVLSDISEDSPQKHAEETIQAGRNLADRRAVEAMTQAAPSIVEKLYSEGMSWTLNADKQPERRAFGGQKYKRTTFAADSTGKQLIHTLTEKVRRYEVQGMIERKVGWQFVQLLYRKINYIDGQSIGGQKDGKLENQQVCGCALYDAMRNIYEDVYGAGVIVASGGLNGLFGNATGSVKNSGYVTASLFADGVPFANGEFIQYHPTTAKLHGKHMLITEAVRGEGGRLFVEKNGKLYYFMEEKYPELGNLMPRDVVSREEWQLMMEGYQIWLDIRGMDADIYTNRLRHVVESCRTFLGIDVTKEPIPVQPGIHYFMGGILVDKEHRIVIKGLYAAGECACQYHGANRLGGNSLLGALYGGKIAAASAAEDMAIMSETADVFKAEVERGQTAANQSEIELRQTALKWSKIEPGQICADSSEDVSGQNCGNYSKNISKLQNILRSAMGIIRNEDCLRNGYEAIQKLSEAVEKEADGQMMAFEKKMLRDSCRLGEAMVLSALHRKESRGAHQRSDYPDERVEYQKTTVARCTKDSIQISFQGINE